MAVLVPVLVATESGGAGTGASRLLKVVAVLVPVLVGY